MAEHTVLAVGSREVSDAEFQQYLLRALENYSRQFKGNFSRSLISQLQIPERALQDMVNSSVIQLECDRLHLEITDEELIDAIRNDSRFQVDGRFIGTADRTPAFLQPDTGQGEAQQASRLVLAGTVQRQSSLLAFERLYFLTGVAFLCVLPLLLLLKVDRSGRGSGPSHLHAEA